MTERSQQRQAEKIVQEKPAKPEAYRWRALTEPVAEPEPLATPKAQRTALEHEKTPSCRPSWWLNRWNAMPGRRKSIS